MTFQDFLENLLGLLVHVEPYLNWHYGKIVLGLLAAAWAIQRLRILPRLASQAKKLLGPVLGEHKARMDARRAEKAGKWLEAGLILERLGELGEALDAYEKAEEYHLCGEICRRMGRKDYAAEWFLLSGEKIRAASLFEERGLFDRAAESYLDAGSSLEAAAAFLKAGQHRRAAEIYAEAGNYLKAAMAFQRAGEVSAAAENFERQLTEAGGGQPGRYFGATERAELARLSVQAAQCYQQVGNVEREVLVLEAGGQYARAAAAAESLGQHRRAAELYERAGEMRMAVEMYTRAGDIRRAASLQGEDQLSSGDAEAAAESFLKSGDPMRAAEVFESVGRHTRAADCYQAVEAFPQAADAALRAGEKHRSAGYFEKAGQFTRAAELYAELGEFERAARFFARSGRFFDAAKAAAEASGEKLMMEYLQRVPPQDPQHHVAVAELARSFIRRGWSSLAVEKLKSVLTDQPVSAERLELWYELALAYEAQGELSLAAEVLHKVLAVQYSYRDASRRHARLLEKIEEELIRESTVRGVAAAGSRRGVPRQEAKDHRYVLEGMLGKGGMGTVYKAYDRLLKRPVAYKVLSDNLARDRAAREQLFREARAAAALNHPNIITVFDLGFQEDQAFICMELIEGESYSSLLRQRKRLEIPEVLHLMVSVCQGLDHAHRRGIVHRDLKPSNILLTVEKRVKIVDFGLAQPIAEPSGAAQGSLVFGTLTYLAPEQARSEPTDARSDIYSLGVSLYELLIGHTPFTEGDLIRQHLHTPPPPLRPERPDVPPALEELVQLCLAKRPADRFQSAGEIISFAAAARLL